MVTKKKSKAARNDKAKADAPTDNGAVQKCKGNAAIDTADALTPVFEHLQLDPRGDGMYSGTFRWQESKRFPPLPPSPCNTDLKLTQGWDGYLRSRSSIEVDLHCIATQDPSMLDALSFPITFIHVANQLNLIDRTTTTHKHIVVLGASRKAEQRVWSITDYWHELAYAYPSTTLSLWFVGPEVESTLTTSRSMPLNLNVRHVRGSLQSFFDAPKTIEATPTNTIIIGYNCGFGNYVETQDFALTFSWLPDLYTIATSGFPMIFTCANDYADVQGEFAIHMCVTGAQFLLFPQQNPFTAASHLHNEGKRDTQWSRGNSFVYAIQHCDSKRQHIVPANDRVQLEHYLDQETDMHLVDAVGRHFYQQTILSKEQAIRLRLPIPTTTKEATPAASPCA